MFTYKILIFYTMFTCAYKHIYTHTHTKKSCVFLQFLKYLCITCVSGPLVGQKRALYPPYLEL